VPKEDSRRAVSRIWSAPLAGRRGPFVLAANTRNRSGLRRTEAGHFTVSYWALHWMRFSVPPRLLLGRWALTPPFHPYPALSELNRTDDCGKPPGRSSSERAGRFAFLWHCLSASLAAAPPACAPNHDPDYAASCPVVFGLSSPNSRRERSSALLKSDPVYAGLPPNTRNEVRVNLRDRG
jgi:hypothetical protein